ncbi:MAG: sugar phosphate isomerase/epimerase [Phycisphaerae bacterium]|nr:sugar phosphate isomerase/epimerase [Phycisphaerae bacterium]
MEPQRLRAGVCSWSLRPEHPEHLLELLAPIGLTRVQLALVPCVESAPWRDAVATLRARGLTIASGMLATVGEDYSTIDTIAKTGGVRPDATWPATRSLAASVAAHAGRESIGLVTFHAGFLPHDAGPERSKMVARLREVADLFQAVGVAVAFETGQESAATLADALREIDHPAVGVNFDPANMILYGMGDPVAAVTTLGPWIRQVHIKDALPAPRAGDWGQEVQVGTGAVRWPDFIGALRDLSRPLDLIIEREAGAARSGDVRVALERLRSWCGADLE